MTTPDHPIPNAAPAVIVRRYALYPPLDWGADCEAQLRGMRDLWNALIEIERENTAKVRAATYRMCPQAQALDQEISAAMARLDELRDEDADERGAIATRLREIVPQAKALRKAARKSIPEEMARIESERRAAVKAARNNSGLWWSNYNQVIAGYEAARSRAMLAGAELHERRSASEVLTNQIQGGMSVEDIFAGAHSQVQIGPCPERFSRDELVALIATVYRRDGTRRTVTWPMVMHRPIPNDATIKEVRIVRRASESPRHARGSGGKLLPGIRHEWSVVFTCRGAAPPEDCGIGAVGIDVGWRRVHGDGIRVATIVDQSGRREFVSIPERDVTLMKWVREIAAERAANLEGVLLAVRAMRLDDAPPAIAAAATALRGLDRPRWNHVMALAEAWWKHETYRPEDRRIVREWRLTELRHLRQQFGTMRRFALRRRELYRTTAARLATTYAVIGIEAIDMAQLQAIHLPRKEAGFYRRLAAPGEFLDCLRKRAMRAGCAVHQHKGKSTFVCADCGTVTRPSDRAELHVTCGGCSAVYDQDVNAARNLVAAALASAPMAGEGTQALAWEKPNGNNGKASRQLLSERRRLARLAKRSQTEEKNVVDQRADDQAPTNPSIAGRMR